MAIWQEKIRGARAIVRAAVHKNPAAPFARITVWYPMREFVTGRTSVITVRKCYALNLVAKYLTVDGRSVYVDMVEGKGEENASGQGI